MNRTEESPEHDEATEKPGPTLHAPRSSLPTASFAPAFHSDDVEHVANYKSLSVLALISLLIGLASPLCLLSKMFLLVPLVGLALSLLALRRIASSEGRLAGRWAAIAGLALCVTCGTTAIARDFVTRSMRTAQAQEFARKWLTRIVSNDMEMAFKETYDGMRPIAPPEPGMPPAEKTPYETFLDAPFTQAVKSAGKDAIIRYEDTLLFARQARRDIIVRQRFLIVPAGDPTKSTVEPIDVDLTLHRMFFRGENARWLITNYELTGAPAP